MHVSEDEPHQSLSRRGGRRRVWVVEPTFIALLALCVSLAGADKKKPVTVLWEFKTGGCVSSSPAIGPDGTVYVGSRDNKLYAIKTDSKGLANSPWPMRGQNARHTGRVMKK